MLHFVTMWLGLLTELYSRPKIYADTQTYPRPVRPKQYQEWIDSGKTKSDFKVDYENDIAELKIIDQSAWDGDRTLVDPATRTVAPRAGEQIEGQLFLNYTRRMYPHILGIFPFVTAWVIIINHIECARADLRVERPGVRIPEWVNAAIYGTVLIFSFFTVVQIVYQRLPPGFYWV